MRRHLSPTSRECGCGTHQTPAQPLWGTALAEPENNNHWNMQRDLHWGGDKGKRRGGKKLNKSRHRLQPASALFSAISGEQRHVGIGTRARRLLTRSGHWLQQAERSQITEIMVTPVPARVNSPPSDLSRWAQLPELWESGGLETLLF